MQTIVFRKSLLNAALAASLGIAALPQSASADIITLNWSGYFHLLDDQGAVFANTSISTKANQYETPISGTMTLDTASGAGTTSVSSFEWLANPIPATFQTMQLQMIGGTLILGNGLWNWGGNTNMPFSIVWDASGLFDAMPTIYANGNGTVISGVGVRGAVDGSFVGGVPAGAAHFEPYASSSSGYMDLGLVPMATTKWNATPLCAPVNTFTCLGVNPSGALPLVADNAANLYDYNPLYLGGDGSASNGIAGSPMLGGPFMDYNLSMDIATMTVTNVVVPQVPLPAAAWLFGSGLAGLVTMARRKR